MVGKHSLVASLWLSSFGAFVVAHPGSHIVEREVTVSNDNGLTNGQLCGVQNANSRCNDGWCCGPDGICGQGGYYCAGPASQFQFSSASDANIVPAGPATENIPRPRFGHVPYGSIITSCLDPGVVALTFDDGPHQYTEELLDYLKRMKVNATFFVTGGSGGKGSIGDPTNQYYNDITRMLAEGHQIASHTWTHQDLSLVGHEYRVQQITKNERAIANNIGLVPTYIRPPYLSCDDACQTDLGDLGYHIVNIDLDTNDWMMDYTAAVNYFDTGINKDPASNGWNVLAHDIHAYTVRQLVPYMVEKLFARGYKPVTIGECLQDDPKNWYRHPVTGEAAGPARARGILPVKSGSPSSTAQSCQPTGTVRTDGRCGKDFEGAVCAKGLCCSEWGWCNGDVGCGTGCQVGFGACDNQFYPCASVTGSMSTSKPTSTSSVANCQPTGTVRTDGRCGKDFEGAVCGTGYCCSEWGWCDNTSTFCGSGCQVGYGLCDGHVYSCPASASKASSTYSSSFATSTSASVSASASTYSASISSIVSSSLSSSVKPSSSVVSSSLYSSSVSSSVKPSSSVVSSSAYSSSFSSSFKQSSSITSSSIDSSSISSSIKPSSSVLSSSTYSSSISSSVKQSSFASSSPDASSVKQSSSMASSSVDSFLLSSSFKSSASVASSIAYSSSVQSSAESSSAKASSNVISSAESASKSSSSVASSSQTSSSVALSSTIASPSSAVISSSSTIQSSSSHHATAASSISSSAIVSSSVTSVASSSTTSTSSVYSSEKLSVVLLPSSAYGASSSTASSSSNAAVVSSSIASPTSSSTVVASSTYSSEKSSVVLILPSVSGATSSKASSSSIASAGASPSSVAHASTSVSISKSASASHYSSVIIVSSSTKASSLGPVIASSAVVSILAAASSKSSALSASQYPASSVGSARVSSIISSRTSARAGVSERVSSKSSASSVQASSARAMPANSSAAKVSSVRPSGARSSAAVRPTSRPASAPPSSAAASARPSPSASPKYSPDGSCGGKTGYTCPSGKCCSQYGWCGVAKDYCGAGCQKKFGGCFSEEGPVASGKISTDYTCGGAAGLSCPKSYCCSKYGWCGKSSDYCQAGCQKLFGKCW